MYWVEYEAPLSVYECSSKYTCPGLDVQNCREAHTGVACGKCIDEYYQDSGGFCMPCGAFTAPIVPILCLLLMPVALAVMYRSASQDIDKWKSATNELLGVFYVAMVYSQTVGQAMNIMPAVPPTLDGVLGWTEQVSDISGLLRLECSFKISYTLMYLFKLLSPVTAAAVFAGTYFAIYPIKRFRLDRDVVFSMYFSGFNTLFISIMNLTLQLFQVYPHPNSEWSLRKSPDILKSSTEWKGLVGFSALFIMMYCVGLAGAMIYAIVKAPSQFHTRQFRLRWKFILLQMRPSAYWWSSVNIIKAIYLASTTAMFYHPMNQTVYLGTGLLIYFLGVFQVLPWRNRNVLYLDVFLHYLLAACCLLMPFFVNTARGDEELNQISTIFMGVVVIGFLFAFICVFGLFQMGSTGSQRLWVLYCSTQARESVEVFQTLKDKDLLVEILMDLPDVDLSICVEAMQILSVEMFGNRETRRLNWRKTGHILFNSKGERGPETVEWF